MNKYLALAATFGSLAFLSVTAEAQLIGVNFSTAASANPNPQNWNRFSAASGTMSDLMSDTGAGTSVDLTVNPAPTGGLVYLGTTTLAANAVPQHSYSLAGMTGYGFRSGGPQFQAVFSDLLPNTLYEYWFVAYRTVSVINQNVFVSNGDVPQATTFLQNKPTGAGAYFVVNSVLANDTMIWDNLALATTSSSTGTITFDWAAIGTETTVVGALAIRVVPEPATIVGLGIGAAMLLALRRRKR